MDDIKKSTYNAKAQKKYNQRFKNIACKCDIDYYNKVVEHMKKKGFTSVNSYLLDLINNDIKLDQK